MYGYIAILALLATIYKLKPYFSTGYLLYKSFKNMIDPDGTKGHFFVLSSLTSFWKDKMNYQNRPPIEKFNRDYIKISYVYKDKPYFYLLKVKRGVTPLLSIVDDSGNDIMGEMIPYLGPNLDCHQIPLTPKDFGYERITVTTVLDSTVTFEENDLISF